MIFISSRKLNLFAALTSVLLLVAGIYLECTENLQPCSLCVLQRGVFVLLSILLFGAFLHNPKQRGIRVYGAFTLLIAGLGVLLAARQVWLQSLPHARAEVCMPGFSYLLSHLPLNQALSAILMGSDHCGVVDWTLWGWSIARWSLLWFMLFGLFGIFQAFKSK
jgi:disulfide bond formation protein DsbB